MLIDECLATSNHQGGAALLALGRKRWQGALFEVPFATNVIQIALDVTLASQTHLAGQSPGDKTQLEGPAQQERRNRYSRTEGGCTHKLPGQLPVAN